MNLTSHVTLDVTKLPKVRRLHISKEGNLILKNQKSVKKISIHWDFEKHDKFLAFLGYWLDKGYYDQQSVVVSVGKDLSGLIQIFDYVSELFECNYRIKKHQVIYFDSALLKYAMIGLGFAPVVKNARIHPNWVSTLPSPLLREFLKGLITACSKVRDGGIFCNTETSGLLIVTKLEDRFATKCQWTNNGVVYIPPYSLLNFKEHLGFLSDYKNSQLEKMLFVEKL